IPFERIQSLNYKESILHRPFKLVKVSLETASDSSDSEAELTAISMDQAKMIEEEMRLAKRQKEKNQPLQDVAEGVSDATATIKKEIYTITNKELILLASTSSSMGLLFSGIAALGSQFSDWIPYEEIYGEMQSLIKFGVLFIILLVLFIVLISWVVAVAISYIGNYGFLLEEGENQLFVSKGLLEKKRITLPVHRIQAIRIVENPLRQLFGYCRVIVDSAGNSGDSNEDKIVLMPFIKKSKAQDLLKELFPQQNWQQHYKKAPRKSLMRYLLKPVYIVAIPLAICSIYFYPYGLISLTILVIVILLAYGQYRTAGYQIEGNQLTFVFRGISKTTFITEKRRIQSLKQTQTIFAERKDVASIHAHIMSGSTGDTAGVKHFDLEDMQEIMEWYKPLEEKNGGIN
ncbi:MAG: PH domain-containing protein, partial [Kurthia sp.]